MAKGKTRRPGRSIDPPLSDRERILMVIIDRLATSQTLAHPDRWAWNSDSYRDSSGDLYYTHFAPWRKPVAGDLVLARTGNVSRWKIGSGKTRRKRDPGRCYRRAGFEHVGYTRGGGGLFAFQMLPPAMPAAVQPLLELAQSYVSR